MMKTKMITTLLILFGTYLYAQDLCDGHYKMIRKIDNIEVREYYESVNISYFDSSSDNYFKYLANYIFGGNIKNEKISMTSPVTMRQYGDQEMIFRLPERFLEEDVPKPNNDKIKVFKLKPKTKAVIQYSGYTNSRIEKKKTAELLETLDQNNIDHLNDIEVDVFNSPFQFINRRNEITVTILTNN